MCKNGCHPKRKINGVTKINILANDMITSEATEPITTNTHKYQLLIIFKIGFLVNFVWFIQFDAGIIFDNVCIG